MAEHRGDAQAAIADLPQIARSAGLTEYAPCSVAQANAELSAGRRVGATPLFEDHPLYPALLAAVPDAPPLLWARGDLGLLGRPALALVGARNASSLGLRMARALSRGAGESGYVTVSGLARGIDAEVHRATLESGTIAVVAGGVDVVYPQENAGLTADIAARGLILSEMPPGHRPQARHFPRRNRIVAGLALALVVVEAAAKSGSLITARDAADLGREVFAVPGHPFDARASGCNMLIRDGATLLRGARDIGEALGRPKRGVPGSGGTPGSAPGIEARDLIETPRAAAPETAAVATHTRGPEPGNARAALLALLGPTPVEEDQLLRDTGLRRAEFVAMLTELEIEGQVARAPGGMLSRTD